MLMEEPREQISQKDPPIKNDVHPYSAVLGRPTILTLPTDRMKMSIRINFELLPEESDHDVRHSVHLKVQHNVVILWLQTCKHIRYEYRHFNLGCQMPSHA